MAEDDLLRSDSILPSRAPGSANPPTPQRANHVGPFELRGTLGEGGMGVVYRAWDPTARREVALKVVKAQDEQRLARFRREGEITARLEHPGILRVHAAGETDGRPYLAYELIDGARSLGDEFPRLTWAERVERVREAASAIGYAHARGVTHRDIKPDNLLIASDGTLKVADFGLGLAADVERLTQTGVMVGTPYYMAPEQMQGARGAVGPASDVWSLGVLLYEALTGTLPFDAGTLAELAIAISSRRPIPPADRSPEIPGALSDVCLRALSKDPDARYPDGAALAEAIAGAERAPRPRAYHPLAAGVALLLLVLGLAVGLRRGPPQPAPTEPDAESLAVVLEAPAADAEVWGDALTLRGRLVRGAHAADEPAVGALQRVLVRAAPGESFAQRVTLRPEAAGLELVVRTPDKREVVLRRALQRVRIPAWFKRGPDAPALPLPPGIRFGSGPGEYVNVRDGSVLVWVPPGTFTMGRSTTIGGVGPAHPVTLTEGFFIGKYEVSWAQYDRYTDAAGLQKNEPRFPITDHLPVHNVNWEDAQAYCAWAGLRLPSEAEWERAARGGHGGFYPWGDEPPDDARVRHNPHADLPGNSMPEPNRKTRPVTEGREGASPYGCLNMAGNVWEWTQEWFVGYTDGPRTDPVGYDPRTAPPDVQGRFKRHHRTKVLLRVVRGGSYRTSEPLFHTYHRDGFRPHLRRSDVGFRVCVAPSDRVRSALWPRWSVRFFGYTADPVTEVEAWRAEGAAKGVACAADRLRFYFKDGGPSDLRGIDPAIRKAALPKDRFGTIATAQVRLPKGVHMLSCISDGAARVWFDGRLVVDAWREHAPETDRVKLTITSEATRTLRVEHFEGAGYATLNVWLSRWRP